jgi:hypothetical protein
MKSVVKDFLFGILVLIVITILEFIVTIPFGYPGDQISREEWGAIINRELLLTAVPGFLTAYVFAMLLKTKSRADAMQKAVFWASILCVNFLVMGIGNDNLDLIFGTIGIYVLIVCTFAGPIAYAFIKRLPKREE